MEMPGIYSSSGGTCNGSSHGFHLLGGQVSPRLTSTRDLEEVLEDSDKIAAATAQVPKLCRRSMIIALGIGILTIGVFSTRLIHVPAKLDFVEVLANHADTINGTSFQIAYSDYKCEAKEWSDFLRKFKIDDHGRGTILDWRSFKDKDKPCSDGNVLWLWPADDHNNAYQINKAACYRLMHWYEGACSVSVVKTESVEMADKALDDYQDQSLKLAVLGGHGSPESLHWGDCSSQLQIGTTCVSTQRIPIWKSATSWETIGHLEEGAKIVTSGSARVVQGYPMVPIAQGGAVELTRLNCDAGKTCVLDMAGTSSNFLKKLSRKMYRDSSILLDSCSTAGQPKEGHSNLAQFVSNTVGKGIRVFASAAPLFTTDVKRWHPFFPQLNRKGPVVKVTDAHCPPWAQSKSTNSVKACLCPARKKCLSIMVKKGTTACTAKVTGNIFESKTSWKTIGKVKAGDQVFAAGTPSMEEGYFMIPVKPQGAVDMQVLECASSRNCPTSQGLWSSRTFLPSCSDSWSSIQCGCI